MPLRALLLVSSAHARAHQPPPPLIAVVVVRDCAQQAKQARSSQPLLLLAGARCRPLLAGVLYHFLKLGCPRFKENVDERGRCILGGRAPRCTTSGA